ncbi:hypothetical protein BDQ17DRAFT_1421324 [Cyathus striatus]|nr:hypothetical protein BDQ17DRAFT_1421324 [Cyathus striatus]
MSHSMHQGASSVPPPSHGYGRTFLIGGSIMAASLAVAWIALLRSTERQQRKGVNPIYEQLIAHVGNSRPTDAKVMPVTRVQSVLPAPPVRDHNHGKMTLPTFYNSDEYLNIGHQARYSAPPPQRAKDELGNDAYGKSPEALRQTAQV